jgi:hypothetical protein
MAESGILKSSNDILMSNSSLNVIYQVDQTEE